MNPETLVTPEPKWLFRRLTTWVVTLLTAAGVGFIIHELAAAGATGGLERIAYCLLTIQAVVLVIYLVAPSAEYVGRISELVRSAKGTQ